MKISMYLMIDMKIALMKNLEMSAKLNLLPMMFRQKKKIKKILKIR